MQNRNNFYNLNNVDYVTDSVVFIGACGWWDFKMCEPGISGKINFDVSWNKNMCLTKEDIVNNIVKKAKQNYDHLRQRIDYLKDYFNICIVTHTVPHKDLLSMSYPLKNASSSHYGNSEIQRFVKEDAVKYFIFGHNHDASLETKKHDKTFINNSRGRPNDFNRIHYEPYTLDII